MRHSVGDSLDRQVYQTCNTTPARRWLLPPRERYVEPITVVSRVNAAAWAVISD